tara:strand:- start:448 stop:672 length:225 start_codon:yes stop_codon:yes gene_type:complete
MRKEKCWVWFKGSLKEDGYWQGGFVGTKDEDPGILIENPSFVTCRVPEWRVRLKEPEHINESPSIPEDAPWKIV